MTTKIIGIKQLSQNLSKLLKQAKEEDIHFIVMRHGEPVANITPTKSAVTDEELIAEGIDLNELEREVAEARKNIDDGEVYSTEELRTMLQL